MEHKNFWMAMDAARERAVDGAQQLGRAAAEAVDAVRDNFGISQGGGYQEYCASAEYLRGRLGGFVYGGGGILRSAGGGAPRWIYDVPQ